MQLNEVLKILEKIAFYLELKNENVFKINAFNFAVRTLKGISVSFDQGMEDGTIQNIKGIGKSILGVLEDIYKSGSSSLLNQIQTEFPNEIYELTRISGLGPKKIKKLYNELNISNLGELEYACKENRLVLIEGFGEKSQEKILNEINRINRTKGYLLINFAQVIADNFIKEVLLKNGINKYEITGELRRSCEVISKIDILIDKNEFINSGLIKIANKINDDLVEFNIEDIKINLHLASIDNFGKELFITTGPAWFTEKYSDNLDVKKNYDSEKAVFDDLKISLIEPELRDNKEVWKKKLKLIEEKDLKGLLHIHTTYSDGGNTIEQMSLRAEQLGFEYILITDHSKSAFYANGLKEDRLVEQWKEIDKLNSKMKIKILKGIEADILNDGSIDYSDDILKNFDCVIASIHSNFKMSEAEMTKRISKALQNKYVKILGHLTGRLLLSREAYKFEFGEIIRVAEGENKVIEFNADPHRLDIDWRFHQQLIAKGIKTSINPDAHSIEGIENIYIGLKVARKGGLQPKDVINTLPYNDFVRVYCNV